MNHLCHSHSFFRFFLLASFLFFTILSSAQTAISLDKVNHIALSPQSSALHDAVNYVVEGNRGVPDISIPLYTIRYGKLTIPIVLRYSTSNAKVDKSTAPNVGFGWVLDVGGSVNRVIRGKPDEASEWYQADSSTYFDQLRDSDDQYTISSLYGWYGSNHYDTEKDEFTTVLRRYSYDNAGRLTALRQSLNGGAIAVLETDTWDAIGRQATRVLGSSVQTVDYAWDIRSRLTALNSPSSLGTDKFGIAYTYETGTSPEYGGNISGATWAHAGGSSQTYAYVYDAYGRLASGTHSGGNSEAVSYDKNGNIAGLTRTGARAETLSYTYTSGTNRLGTITTNGTNKGYSYNADGTMSSDGLRGLSYTYNALKLPKTVGNTSSTVTFIYDAWGNKLAVSQAGTVKNYYCGDFVYDSGLDVAYILTPNGQLTRDAATGTFTVQYNITDHLGNVRSVVSSGGTVLQSTDYYPFGLAFSDSNIPSNRYLYNGKELQDYTIGTSYLGTLDYGARHYDARIARWTVPDPMTEKYYGMGAYNYCAGNPVMLVDPDGKDIWEIDSFGKIVSRRRDRSADTFILIDDKGQRLNSISFDYGNVTATKKQNRFWGRNTTSISLSSEEAGATLFKFFADNLKIEFGLITIGPKGALVVSSHENHRVPVSKTAKAINREWDTIVSKIIHNHPENSDPSKSDIESVRIMPKAKHYVYLSKTGELIEYGISWKKEDRETIPWITIFPPTSKQ